MLFRLGGGGIAALLATLGIGGLGVEEADAKKSCRKRCKKRKTAAKRRRCRRRCKKAVGPECRGTGDCQGTGICIDNQCVDRPTVDIACSDTTPCNAGRVCVAGLCALECDEGDDEACDGALICLGGACVLDTECENDADCDNPLLNVCLLGLCVDDIL